METYIDDLWEYISMNSKAFHKSFTKYTSEITRLLVLYLLHEGDIGTGLGYKGCKTWAMITMNEYDSETQLSLSFHGNDVYDLYFEYYDDDKQKSVAVNYILTEQEIEGLPPGLRDLLKSTLQKGKSQHISGKQLSLK